MTKATPFELFKTLQMLAQYERHEFLAKIITFYNEHQYLTAKQCETVVRIVYNLDQPVPCFDEKGRSLI